MSQQEALKKPEPESGPDAAALAITDRSQAGILALAQMPEDEFEQRLEVLKRGQDRIRRIKKELMQEDVHYGVIPHTDKPALYKAGAELLCSIYSLRAQFHPEVKYGDGILSPPISVLVRCDLHLGDLDGPIVASGYGSANSWERKYRYRRGERSCPDCEKVGAVIKGKETFGGGWVCWAKKGGCGARFEDNDPRITQQVVGDIENPDQLDLDNTIVKMAEKRSFTGATLRGTASSDLFTQDDEDVIDVDPMEGDGPQPQRRGNSGAHPSAPAPEISPEERQQRAELLRKIAAARVNFPDAYVKAARIVHLEGSPSTNTETETLERLLSNLRHLAEADAGQGSREPGSDDDQPSRPNDQEA